jgi:hypothetical protein
MAFDIIFELDHPQDISKNPRQEYHEYLRNSDRLLITCGDSWTWGDSLGKISMPEILDDYEHRTTHIYGHLMATHLNADFINRASCGCSNIRIHDMLAQLLPKVVNRYKKIDVVITLTELCREITGDPIWVNDNLDTSSLTNFLKSYEYNMLVFFKKLFDSYPSINFLVARNFTFTYQDNLDICPHIEKNWTTILAENQEIGVYPAGVRLLSQMGIHPLVTFLTKNNLKTQFKRDLLEEMLLATDGIDWLDKSTFNYKKATKHPTEQGHELWANYLLTYLDK